MINWNLRLFDAAFSVLLSLNMNARESAPLPYGEEPTMERLRDLHTVRLDPGSRTGKTTWIASTSNGRLDALVFPAGAFPSGSLSDAYRHEDIHEMLSADGSTESERRTPAPHITKKYRYVFVDSASSCTAEFIKGLYYLFGSKDVTFVLVG